MNGWGCAKCGHKMRPANTPIAKAPGTRQHRSMGLCKTCYYQERAAGNITEPTKRGRKPSVESVPASCVFDERLAAVALEGYLMERRRRLAAR